MDSKAGPILPYAIPATSGAASLSPEDIEKLVGELAAARQTIAHKDAVLNAANLKIQALTPELARHKRMRFGQRSEALAAAGQRELFGETVAADLSAIEAELEEAGRALKPPPPASPAPAPGGSRCPPTCRASNTATNPSPAPAASAAASRSKSARMSASRSTSSPPSSPCTATSAPDTPANTAKR